MGRRSEGRGSFRAHGVRARPSPLGLPVARPRLMGRHVGERRADRGIRWTMPLDSGPSIAPSLLRVQWCLFSVEDLNGSRYVFHCMHGRILLEPTLT